jgi:hypothetical protein
MAADFHSCAIPSGLYLTMLPAHYRRICAELLWNSLADMKSRSSSGIP